MTFLFILNKITDTILAPFQGMGAVPGLALLSLLTAVTLLNIFKRLSNQEKIKRHKGKVFGHFLEIALYRDQFRRTIICQANILKHNVLYMRYFMTPILIMMLPMLLVCIQIDYRLGSQPFDADDTFIISVALDKNILASTPDAINKVILSTSDGITLQTPMLRDIKGNQLFWRARINNTTDKQTLTISTGDTDVVQKQLAVRARTDLTRFSPNKTKITTFNEALLSGEESIATASVIKNIRVNYPTASYPFFIWLLSPIVYYFILTLSFGLLIKPFIKVNI